MSNCQNLATKQDVINLYQLINQQAARIDNHEKEIEWLKVKVLALITGIAAMVAIAAAPLIATAIAGVITQISTLGASIAALVARVSSACINISRYSSSYSF
jgi:hypothetical protein